MWCNVTPVTTMRTAEVIDEEPTLGRALWVGCYQTEKKPDFGGGNEASTLLACSAGDA